MLTKGAIGNLINRYRAVLKKCTLINVFGSLAVASMLVMSTTSPAAADVDEEYLNAVKEITTWADGAAVDVTGGKDVHQLYFGGSLAENGKDASVENTSLTLSSGKLEGELNAGGTAIGEGSVSNVKNASITISGGTLTYMTDHPDEEYFAPVRGGGVSMNGGTANVDNAVINITNGAKLNSEYTQVWAGGVNESGAGEAHTGNAVINITNADLSENHVYGGSDMATVGTATINIDNSSVKSIFAGGDDDVVDQATINVSGNSKVYKIITGGSTNSTVKNTTVNVYGGTVGDNSTGIAIGTNEGGGSPDDLLINISGGTVKGDIMATAGQSAAVTINGDAPVIDGKIQADAGKSSLNLVNRSTFDGSIFSGFNSLNVTGTTSITGGLNDGNVGSALSLGGSGETVADVSLTTGTLTVENGTLSAENIDLSDNGNLVVNGGTLKTSSGQAFTGSLGADGLSTDPSAVQEGLSLESGRLALTDAYYNLAYVTNAEDLLKDTTVELAMLGTLKGGGNMVIGTNNNGEVENVSGADTTEKSSATFNSITLTGGNVVAVNNGNTVTLLGDGGKIITTDQESSATLKVGSSGQNNNAGTVNLGDENMAGSGSLDKTELTDSGNLNVVNGDYSIGQLVAESGSLVTVGSTGSAGRLTVNEADLNGAGVFLDPAWKDDPSVDILDNASHAVFGGSEVNGKLTAGQNSMLVLGDTSSDWAMGAFKDSGLTWGKNGITAALAIADSQTLESTGSLLVDGSLTSADFANAGDATFADKSLLMVNGAAASGNKVALTGTGTGTLSVADGAKLYIRDAGVGTYTITSKFNTTDLNGWQDDDLILNRLVSGTTSLDENGNVIVTTTSEDISQLYPGIKPVNSLNALSLDSDSDYMGVRFLSRAMDENMLADNAVTDTVNEVSQPAVTAGVQNTSLRLSDAASDTVLHHLSLGNYDSGNSFHQDGVDMWATPMYGNTYMHGMGASGTSVRSNYGGIAFGADTQIGEVAGGKVRAGIALNGGGGKSETRGTATSTENSYNFGGINLYSGWNLNNLNVMASLGYSIGDHDVKMSLPSSMQMGQAKADIDTGVFTADLRAEYQIKTNWLDILPHAGVRYTSLHTDSYNLKVNGSTLNNVKSDTQNIVQFPVGVTVTKNIDAGGWNIKPQADVSIIPAAGEKKAFTKVHFSGVDATDGFNTRIMDSTSWAGMVGVQAEKGNLSLGLNYGVQASSHETDQGVRFTLGWKF